MPTILITGANSGIGKRTAELFAERGWQVAATMRSLEKAGTLANQAQIHLYQLDVSDRSSVDAALKACLNELGNIDVLVNNAGFGVYGAVEIATEEQIDRQFEVNVKGVIRVMQSILPHFRATESGLFINISSIAGLISYPLGALYNASKWALEGLTEGMYFELKPQGIRVKLVEPGGFKTNFQEVGLNWTRSETISVYDSMTEAIQTRRAKAQPHLPDAIAVAEKIWEAANDPTERLRYLVGEDAIALESRREALGAQAFMEELYEKMVLGNKN